MLRKGMCCVFVLKWLRGYQKKIVAAAGTAFLFVRSRGTFGPRLPLALGRDVGAKTNRPLTAAGELLLRRRDESAQRENPD